MKLEKDDLVIFLPTQLVQIDEQSLKGFVKDLVMKIAELGYQPLDFGEDTGTSIELWFYTGDDVESAKARAAKFIEDGGY